MASTTTTPTSLGSWGALYDAFQAAGITIPTSASSQFQFVTTPTVAAWTDEDELYYADFYGNYPSSALGPVFVRSVGTISDAYFDFVNSLEYPDPSTNPEYRSLVAEQNNLNGELGDAKQNASTAYQAWVANGGPATFPAIQNYTDWLASGPAGGQEYANQIASLQAQLDNVNQQLVPFLTGSDAAIAQAVSNAATTNMVTTAIPDSGQTKKVYVQSISPDLATLLQGWLDGEKSNAVTVQLTGSSSSSGDWYVQGEAAAGFAAFFGVVTEGKVSYSDQVEQDAAYQCDLSVQALSTFGIARSQWFDGSLLEEYPDGPWSGKTADQYFGPNGTLKLVPSEILVSFGLQMTLTLSESTMSTVTQQWKTATGVLVGPFFFGSEAVSKASVVSNEDGTQTVTISSDDNLPYVVGYLSQSFYNGD